MTARVCGVNDGRRGYRCELMTGHAGDHQAFYMGGRAAAWPNDAEQPREPAAAGASFDELLEHLKDLADLARSERFVWFALALEMVMHQARENPATFTERSIAPSAEQSSSLRRST